ncbi:hypothetical protein LOC71_23350 [Rhodopirellula sp. JC740]|uniref:HEAT repeat domain-containing protein n=1 Tax=Rhodopirellula halodulae TaxID=2894198 RepID=A0ABS8NNS7_9BACT|nr:hypothetical protein [Rhodopirellula sp. JC740]
MFFKPKANLSDSAKSRIEFCLQQIAECLGFERFTLPVLSRKALFSAYDSEQNSRQFVAYLGRHLKHDVQGIQVRVGLPQAPSLGGGCCGGGSCSGPGELPGRYDATNRSITLDQQIDIDPAMGLATLINGVVCDLLSQNNFAGAHLPEQVELAVIGTGLGMIRNGISLVAKHPTSWDSTQWELSPRPFLDSPSLAYTNAIAAWARGEHSPSWATELPSDLKRPMQKSLKFLAKTNDSFFQPKSKQPVLSQSQTEWWQLAASLTTSNQVIAIRHLQSFGALDDEQESLLLDKLRSTSTAITLHAIAAVERMAVQHPAIANEMIVNELSTLTDHRNDEVRAKSMCVLARLGALDDATVETAAIMLEAHPKHVVFAGLLALSTRDTVPEEALLAVDRCFVRLLRACDYDFVELIVAAYRRWLNDPQPHLEELFQNSPELLPIALETLQNVPQQLVPLRRSA